MKPHKHAKVIKAWADGAKVQSKNLDGVWVDDNEPWWDGLEHFRIKPKTNPDLILYGSSYDDYSTIDLTRERFSDDEFMFVFDGKTKKIKYVKVLDD